MVRTLENLEEQMGSARRRLRDSAAEMIREMFSALEEEENFAWQLDYAGRQALAVVGTIEFIKNLNREIKTLRKERENAVQSVQQDD